MRSAAGFQLVIIPSSDLLIMASSDDSTIAAKCAAASSEKPDPSLLSGISRQKLGVVRRSPQRLRGSVGGETLAPEQRRSQRNLVVFLWSWHSFVAIQFWVR